MANTNDPKQSKKNLDPAAAQKLRQQLADKVSGLTDDELTAVAGGIASPFSTPIVYGPTGDPNSTVTVTDTLP